MLLLAGVLCIWTTAAAAAAGPSNDREPDPQLAAVRGLLARKLSAAQAASIELVLLPQAGLEQRMEIGETARGGVRLAGTSGVALASALNRYLQQQGAQVNVWWTDQTATLPKTLPPPARNVSVTSPFVFSNYLNICAFGYSTPWYDWPRWEREIDWMALNGVVNPLAMVGQDALWLETFAEDFGVDRAALLGTFFAGPTYQPWHWMGNLNGWGGPVDEAFLTQQLELQQNITARMASFGMKPVLPAFAGHVPKQMQELFPAANVTQLAPWHGHMPEGTYFLSPAGAGGELFRRIGAAFLERQAAAYGVAAWAGPHYYLADAYNEMPPPTTDPVFLADVSRTIYQSMAASGTDRNPYPSLLQQATKMRP